MLIEQHKRIDSVSTISSFSFNGEKLDSLDIFNIPLAPSSVQILIYNKNKELVFEGFDITMESNVDSFLLLDNLDLQLSSGDYWLVINQPLADYPIIRSESHYNSVDSPSSVVIVLSALILALLFRRK